MYSRQMQASAANCEIKMIHRTAMAIGFYRTSRTQWVTQHEHHHNLILKWLIQGIYWKIKTTRPLWIYLLFFGKKKLTFESCFSHEKMLPQKKKRVHTFRTTVSIGTPRKLQLQEEEKKRAMLGFGNGCLHMNYTNRYALHCLHRDLYVWRYEQRCLFSVLFFLLTTMFLHLNSFRCWQTDSVDNGK